MPLPTPFPVPTDAGDVTKTDGNLENPGFGGSAINSVNAPGPREGALVITTVTEKALTSNVATLTCGPHGFIVGDSVIVNIGDSIFDGSYTLTAKTSTTVSYSKTHADVTAGPYTISNKAITSYVATLTIGTHQLVVGDYVTVSGLTGFNGTFRIDAKAATTISFKLYSADVASASASGTVTRASTLGSVEKTGTLDPTLGFVSPVATLPAQAAAKQAMFDTDSHGL